MVRISLCSDNQLAVEYHRKEHSLAAFCKDAKYTQNIVFYKEAFIKRLERLSLRNPLNLQQ